MFEITIAPLALQNIEDEIFKRGRDIIADGGEVGGFLWSQKGVDWWSGLNIQIAGDAGPNAEHGFRMINFDMPYFHEMNAVLSVDHGMECVGSWHTHKVGDGIPSDADYEHVLSLLDYRDRIFARTRRALLLIMLRTDTHHWTPVPWVFHKNQLERPGNPVGCARVDPAYVKGE